MTIYIRQSGAEIELKDTEVMVKYAESQGWKKKKGKPGRKPKADKV
jgi:hypothetical protein